MYGDMCYGPYHRSMLNMASMCTAYGIPMTTYYTLGDSLITRARNNCVRQFYTNEHFTHLMFVDADIGFKEGDLLSMYDMCSSDDKYDIIAGVYPKKIYPEELVFNPLEQGTESDVMTPAEVLETGTGFMMIKRKVIEKYISSNPDIKYTPEPNANMKDHDGQKPQWMVFQAEIKGTRYLSEDYNFCQKCKDLGFRIWVCPWIALTHTGTHTYTGSLQSVSIARKERLDAERLRKDEGQVLSDNASQTSQDQSS
jgi:hypothetical protein